MSFLSSALLGTAKVIKFGIDIAAQPKTTEGKTAKKIANGVVDGTFGGVNLLVKGLEEAGKNMFK